MDGGNRLQKKENLMPRSNRNDVKISFGVDEIDMLDSLCKAWNIRQRATVARKIIVDSLKEKQRSGIIPGAVPGKYPPENAFVPEGQ